MEQQSQSAPLAIPYIFSPIQSPQGLTESLAKGKHPTGHDHVYIFGQYGPYAPRQLSTAEA